VRTATILKICVLATGSTGNSTFIRTDRTRILIDAGLSKRELTRRLSEVDESAEQLDAILVTHEHSDHVCGLVALARTAKCPVFITNRTALGVDWGTFQAPLEHFQAGSQFTIGDLTIDSFTIPHDAADPVAFSVSSQGVKASIVTDLGYLPESIRFHLRETDFLLLECNHDLEMLRVGPYPWSVKQRVMGRRGHLSNELVAKYLKTELSTSVSTLVLGHISEHNNHPQLVRVLAERALDGRLLLTKYTVAEPNQRLEPVFY
jgi:phosphoribosyl 1,2-cyclic phosphodiesterase